MTCPWCGSDTSKQESGLGRMGNRFHYRCRWCGGMFSKKVRVPESKSKKAVSDG